MRRSCFPHSLRALVFGLTYYTGFKGQFRRVQGDGPLPPYGQPKYAQLIMDNVIDIQPDGYVSGMDMKYFDLLPPVSP